MPQFTLSKSNPIQEFKLNSRESSVHIKRVVFQAEAELAENWVEAVSGTRVIGKLEYIVFEDPEGRFKDHRTLAFPIHLSIDPYQSQAVFKLDRMVRNETFTIGLDPKEHFYSSLKIEAEGIPEECSLLFEVELFEVD